MADLVALEDSSSLLDGTLYAKLTAKITFS